MLRRKWSTRSAKWRWHSGERWGWLKLFYGLLLFCRVVSCRAVMKSSPSHPLRERAKCTQQSPCLSVLLGLKGGRGHYSRVSLGGYDWWMDGASLSKIPKCALCCLCNAVFVNGNGTSLQANKPRQWGERVANIKDLLSRIGTKAYRLRVFVLAFLVFCVTENIAFHLLLLNVLKEVSSHFRM